ncbi:tetratricopeptide repeat protein [Bremerella sp. JC770]|uniref:tetratricopeptide repeat protein n=1 Tax=Bremerella sp. JC770 TaxID=3232137 RepID=UPI003459DBE0
MWRDVLAKNPSNARAYHGIAQAYIAEGDWAKAIPYLEKTIELHPEYKFKGGYAQRFLEGAKKSIAVGDAEMAMRLLDLSIKMNPQDAEAYVFMAQLIQRPNPQQAIALLQLSLQRDPENQEAQQLLRQLAQ